LVRCDTSRRNVAQEASVFSGLFAFSCEPSNCSSSTSPAQSGPTRRSVAAGRSAPFSAPLGTIVGTSSPCQTLFITMRARALFASAESSRTYRIPRPSRWPVTVPNSFKHARIWLTGKLAPAVNQRVIFPIARNLDPPVNSGARARDMCCGKMGQRRPLPIG